MRLLTACACVLAIAIAVPLTLSSVGSTPRAAGIGPTAPPNVVRDNVDDSAQVYIAVLRYALSSPAGPVWILTHTSSDIVPSNGGASATYLIASDVRDEISAELTYATWVDKSPVQGLDNKEHGTLVTLGPVEHVGSQVHVAIETWCGGLCAEGKTLVLRQVAGVWRVVGTTGPEWVS